MSFSQKFEMQQGETYLLYRFNGELYGTPLSMVQEVVPYQLPRPIPNTHKNYLGLINLRGDIVSVVDIRIWFKGEKLNAKTSQPRALVVVNSQVGVIAITVDSIEGVFVLDAKDVETSEGIPGAFASGGMIGIGKFKQGLATLLDLHTLCSKIDVVTDFKERMAS